MTTENMFLMDIYMIDFYNNSMPFINTAGGLRIGGLSTVGYNTGDLVFQGTKFCQCKFNNSQSSRNCGGIKLPSYINQKKKNK